MRLFLLLPVFLGAVASFTAEEARARLAMSPDAFTSWPCAFYISSSSGNDANEGTLSSPFRTLSRGQMALRSLARPLSGPAVACIRGGLYNESLVLDGAQDSGSAPGAPVAFAAFGGEAVTLSAGAVPVSFVPLSRAQRESIAASIPVASLASSSLLVTSLSAVGLGPSDFGDVLAQGGFTGCVGSPLELLVEGTAQTLARWPNAEAGAFGGPYTTTVPSWDSSLDSFRALPDAPFLSWSDTSDLWLHGYWWWDWNDYFLRVASMNASSGLVVVAPPYDPASNISGAARYYALNSLDALDAPGEYYLNRSGGDLYFFPPAGFNASTSKASVSVGAHAVSGGSGLSFFALVGLSFQGSRSDAVSFAGGSGATSLSILNCTVTHAGRGAFDIYDTSDVLVQGSIISGTGGGGISVGGDDNRTTLTSSRRVVQDNVVHDFERICFTYAFGIAVDGTGALVQRNEIFNSPHSGATVRGNNLLFRYNILHNLTMDTFDNAALYFEPNDWTVWNMTLDANFAYLNGQLPTLCNMRTSCLRASLYMDNAGAGLTVTRNIIWQPSPIFTVDEYHNSPIWVCFNNDGGRNTMVENNIFVDCVNGTFNSGGGLAFASFGQLDNSSSFYADMRAVGWSSGVFGSSYPALAALQDFASSEPTCAQNPLCPPAPYNNSIVTNLAINLSSLLLPPVPKANFPASLFDISNNLVNPTDPGFVQSDPRATLDFTLRPDSPVYTQLSPPFQRIPSECFGPWSGCN